MRKYFTINVRSYIIEEDYLMSSIHILFSMRQLFAYIKTNFLESFTALLFRIIPTVNEYNLFYYQTSGLG